MPAISPEQTQSSQQTGNTQDHTSPKLGESIALLTVMDIDVNIDVGVWGSFTFAKSDDGGNTGRSLANLKVDDHGQLSYRVDSRAVATLSDLDTEKSPLDKRLESKLFGSESAREVEKGKVKEVVPEAGLIVIENYVGAHATARVQIPPKTPVKRTAIENNRVGRFGNFEVNVPDDLAIKMAKNQITKKQIWLDKK